MISATVSYDLGKLDGRMKAKNEAILEKMREQSLIIAEEATNIMKTYLQTHSKHATGELAGLLQAKTYRRGQTIYVSLANKSELTSKVPYWYVLNYGVGKSGAKFLPVENYGKWKNGKWIHIDKSEALDGNGRMKKGVRYLKPRHFTPVHYINAGIAYAKQKLSTLSRLMKK